MGTRLMVSAVLTVLIMLALVPAWAQENEGSMQQSRSGVAIGPQLGVYKAKDADGVRVMGGAALRLRLSEALGVEGSINYREETYGEGFVKATSWPIMVTGLIYPIPIVYGAIGAGWYNTSISYNLPAGALGGPSTLSSETKQAFGWHFGGGLELPVGSFARLVGDIRYVFLNYDFNSFPGSNGVKNDFYVVTAGFLFNL
jgi:opacity protein-like surface antigen